MTEIREVTPLPMNRAPFKTSSYYGLKPGETLRITSGLSPYFQESMPKRIEFLKEYKYFLLCMAHYGEEHENRKFRFCINKASLVCGETKVKRASTGKMLK